MFGISRSELKVFLERSLNKREKELFYRCYRYRGYNFSQVIRSLNGHPESTVKLILKRLKEFALLDFGDTETKGKPLNYTKLGILFYKTLGGELE